MTIQPWKIKGAVPFLESLGFEFHLDFDEELQIEYPEDLTPEEIATAAGAATKEIVEMLKGRARTLRRQHFGGPMHGKPHGGYWWNRPVYHLGFARWAAYVIDRDGRAIYVGEATSKKKAQKLALDDAVARGLIEFWRRPN